MIRNLIYKSQKRFSYSYRHGAASYPLKYLTIGAQLRDTAHKFPNNTAVIADHQNIKLSYPELYERAQKVAAAFVHLGFKKHDRIGIYSPNCIEWIITQYAASIADVILVNINPAYQMHELKYALNKVGCKGIITASKFKSSNYIEMLNEIIPELKSSSPGSLNSSQVPELRALIRIDDTLTPGFYNFKELYDMPGSNDFKELGRIEQDFNPEDATNIQFTSGTTGSPKGAVLSHLNILNNGYTLSKRLKYTDKDMICVQVPLYHCFGMVMGNLGALNAGASVVYPSDGFNPKASLEAIKKHGCTSLYGVPTMFIECIKEFDKGGYSFNTLNKGIMAGSLCPRPLMEDCIKKLGITEMAICYGMTETSPVSVMTYPDDSIERRVSTVGNVNDHVEVKIVDDNGKTCPYNTPGDLWARGYLVMREYWKDPEGTAKTKTVDGWLKSGDVGTMDEQGYVTIVGRIKDMIIRGGENVYPKELEDFLTTAHPNIENVQVFGVPDERFGEEICAWIKLRDPSKPLDKMIIKDYCHKRIAHYKVPKYVKVVSEMPMTVTAKPQKFKMRDMMAHELKDPKKVEEYKIR